MDSEPRGTLPEDASDHDSQPQAPPPQPYPQQAPTAPQHPPAQPTVQPVYPPPPGAQQQWGMNNSPYGPQPLHFISHYIPGAIVVDGATWIPAGFAPRLLAYMIDFAILQILLMLMVMLLGLPKVDDEEATKIGMQVVEELFVGKMPDSATQRRMEELQRPAEIRRWLLLGIAAAYYCTFYLVLGATAGKLAVGLRLMSRNGRPVTAIQVAVRHLVYYLTGWAAYTGWLTFITFLSPEKRTLHDIASGCNVYRQLPAEAPAPRWPGT